MAGNNGHCCGDYYGEVPSDLAILVHLISDEQLNLNKKYDNSTDNSTSKKIKPPVRYVFKLRN